MTNEEMRARIEAGYLPVYATHDGWQEIKPESLRVTADEKGFVEVTEASALHKPFAVVPSAPGSGVVITDMWTEDEVSWIAPSSATTLDKALFEATKTRTPETIG